MRPLHRARTLERVNAAYDRFLGLGFLTAPFEGQPEPERLQCRNELDRTNWLGLVVKCQYAAGIGMGDVLAAGTRLRCSSNRMYDVTPNDAYGRMLVLLDQADQAQQTWWDLKDQVRSAATADELNAIEAGLGEAWD